MHHSISLLGSTGSIGTQTLDVCESLEIRVPVLACGRQIDKLLGQIARFHPSLVVVGGEEEEKQLLDALMSSAFETEWKEKVLPFVKKREEEEGRSVKPRVLHGSEGLKEAVLHPEVDLVVAAMVGFAGLEPVLEAVRIGRDVAIANKETLVTAGEILLPLACETGSAVLPIDSEHSAIWQCLRSGRENELSKIFLTASGGPFRTWKQKQILAATKKEALKHPTWSMGAKITVDSATLMNKGLEVIEAARLFGVKGGQIQVVVHPESIVHSMVEFTDGSVIAQLGFPDMRHPIQYALTYPKRLEAKIRHFDPFDPKAATLHFEAPRPEVFPLLGLAYEALKLGGLYPTVLNAANEVAVAAFLEDKIRLGGLFEVVEKTFTSCSTLCVGSSLSTDGIMEADIAARQKAKELIN